MNKNEYLKAVDEAIVNTDRVKTIEKIYGFKADSVIAGILSLADKIDFFDEERRALSYDEIRNPNKNMDIDFVSLAAVPLIDAYDNTFIVYLIQERKWAKYSSSDNVFYRKKATFEEVL